MEVTSEEEGAEQWSVFGARLYMQSFFFRSWMKQIRTSDNVFELGDSYVVPVSIYSIV